MFFSRVRIFAALIAATSATAPSAYSASSSEPAAEESPMAHTEGAVEFAKILTSNATAALTNEAATKDEQLADFQSVLADGLALETIGKFMLGETRKTMTEEQTDRYNTVFPNYITKLYAEQFDEIVGRPLEVIDAREINKRDVIVRTQFEREEGSPIMVDWRVRTLRSGARKAIDIIVSGVSIMLVKREEFSSFIEANGVDALIDQLEEESV